MIEYGGCGVCGRSVRLKSNGKLWQHKTTKMSAIFPYHRVICAGTNTAPLKR